MTYLLWSAVVLVATSKGGWHENRDPNRRPHSYVIPTPAGGGEESQRLLKPLMRLLTTFGVTWPANIRRPWRWWQPAGVVPEKAGTQRRMLLCDLRPCEERRAWIPACAGITASDRFLSKRWPARKFLGLRARSLGWRPRWAQAVATGTPRSRTTRPPLHPAQSALLPRAPL